MNNNIVCFSIKINDVEIIILNQSHDYKHMKKFGPKKDTCPSLYGSVIDSSFDALQVLMRQGSGSGH